jgi:hypothetical protein
VDPAAVTVQVRRPGEPPVTLNRGDTLDGEDVVPGFRCAVAALGKAE